MAFLRGIYKRLSGCLSTTTVTPIVESDEVKTFKKSLLAIIEENDPPEFFDFIGGDLLVSPVITEAGQLFEKASITRWLAENSTCPLTRAPLLVNQWIDASLLRNVIDAFSKDKREILSAVETINSMHNQLMYRKCVEDYVTMVRNYREQFQNTMTLISRRAISEMKNQLKINISSPAHLRYWSEKKGCCGAGLVRVFVVDKSYYISPRAYKVMTVANQEYKQFSGFRSAINNAAVAPLVLGRWSRFWGAGKRAAIIESPDFTRNISLSALAAQRRP